VFKAIVIHPLALIC